MGDGGAGNLQNSTQPPGASRTKAGRPLTGGALHLPEGLAAGPPPSASAVAGMPCAHWQVGRCQGKEGGRLWRQASGGTASPPACLCKAGKGLRRRLLQKGKQSGGRGKTKFRPAVTLSRVEWAVQKNVLSILNAARPAQGSAVGAYALLPVEACQSACLFCAPVDAGAQFC